MDSLPVLILTVVVLLAIGVFLAIRWWGVINPDRGENRPPTPPIDRERRDRPPGRNPPPPGIDSSTKNDMNALIQPYVAVRR